MIIRQYIHYAAIIKTAETKLACLQRSEAQGSWGKERERGDRRNLRLGTKHFNIGRREEGESR